MFELFNYSDIISKEFFKANKTHTYNFKANSNFRTYCWKKVFLHMSDIQSTVRMQKLCSMYCPRERPVRTYTKTKTDVYSKWHICGVHTLCASTVRVEVGRLAFSGVVCSTVWRKCGRREGAERKGRREEGHSMVRGFFERNSFTVASPSA